MNKLLNMQNLRLAVALVVLIGLIGLAVPLVAQPNNRQGRGNGPDFQRLAVQLNLSEAQTEQFVAVMQEQHANRKAMRQQKREAMQSVREAHQAETTQALSGILDSQQMTAFAERVEKRRQSKKNQRGSQNPNQDAGL